jgi:hypothetical protein
MLRVEFEDVGDTLTMRLQGRFLGPFAKDTKDLVTSSKIPLRLVVNLSEVTFVDATGEEMLSWLARTGGRFIKGPQFFPTSDSPGKQVRTFLAVGNGRSSRASIAF